MEEVARMLFLASPPNSRYVPKLSNCTWTRGVCLETHRISVDGPICARLNSAAQLRGFLLRFRTGCPVLLGR